MSTATAPTKSAASALASWRTPAVLIAVGCAIALIAFGPRSALGQFLSPLSSERGWGRDVFAFAFATQNLLWGAAQPFAGGIADRFGPVRVLCAGAILYAAGLVMMVYATTPLTLDLTAGVVMGFGLAGCSFPMVVGALGKLVPESWRSFAFGAGTAAGSFGQFLYSPLAHALIDARHFAQDRLGSPYLMPQVLVNVDHRMRVMREESFGPVVGIMRVHSDTEALTLMNDSAYGLTASIWTRDTNAAQRLGERLAVGTVFMNRCDYLDPALAWSGVKDSGMGCSLSSMGYEQLTRPKSFHLRTNE